MKNLNTYISEKLVITHYKSYSCAPETKDELKEIIKERLSNDPNADLNDINVSKITDMSYLFDGLDPHDIDISKWDVSNITNMNGMFFQCKQFTSDLNNWDVSNVENMRFMFSGCTNFNSDLSNWDVSRVKDKRNAFDGCINMKELPAWYMGHYVP